MFKVAIVEDEETYANTLLSFCGRFSRDRKEELQPVLFSNPTVFLEKYRGDFDLVLMDIRMPLMDGMECARRLRSIDENVSLCFVTSLAQYAIRGYEVGAMDFIVKPLNYEVFQAKMSRILRMLKKRVPASLVLSGRGTMKKIDLMDLYYVETFGHNLVYHTADGNFESYGDLVSLEKDDRFRSFLRVHHSYFVNSIHVTSFEAETLTVHGERLPVSRRRRKECFEKLAGMIGGACS